MPKMESKLSSVAGSGCLMLFGLPFAIAGFAAFGWALKDAVFWSSAQRWVATPATLLEVDARTVKSSYRVDARYRYEFDGKTFESDRVAVHQGSDNISSYNLDRGRELEQALAVKQPVTAYINPADPSEAVLFRDLRPGLVALKSIFALVFAGVGLGIIAGGVWGLRCARRTRALQAQYPDEPWKWRDAWLASRLRSNAGLIVWPVVMFALLWNLLSFSALFGMVAQSKLEFGPILLILLFPLIGVGLAAWAIYLIAHRWKWGVSEFELAATPGVLGGPLAGVIYVPANISPEGGFTIRLSCVETLRERSGGKSSSREVVRWQTSNTVVRDLNSGDDRTLIPAKFIVPYGLPSSGEENIAWKLAAEAATPGVDYHAEFEVPIFETPHSNPNERGRNQGDGLQPYSPPALPVLVGRLRAELEENFPDRRVIYFPMLRNRGMAFGVSAAALVAAVVAVGMAFADVTVFVPLGIGFLALLLLIVAVRVAFERSRVEYGVRGIAVQRSILRTGERRHFPPETIADIVVDRSGTEVNGVPYWKIVLRADDDSLHTLATEIKDRQDADDLAEDVRNVIGLSQRPYEAASSRELDAELPAEFRGE